MDVVLPANLAPHWLFRVGAEPHFPCLEQFPTQKQFEYTRQRISLFKAPESHIMES